MDFVYVLIGFFSLLIGLCTTGYNIFCLKFVDVKKIRVGNVISLSYSSLKGL